LERSALRKIRAGGGKHFDARVVEAFARIPEEDLRLSGE